MSFPFLGRYLWGEGKKRAAIHSFTAKREHEDLSEIAQILNNLTVKTVLEEDAAELDRQGVSWTIKVPGRSSITEPGASESAAPTRLELVSDVRFDPATGQLQKKIITLIFGGGTTAGEWQAISGGQAAKCP